MTSDENKALIRDYHQRLWGQGDLSVIDTVWAADATARLTGFDDTALSAVRADAARYWGAFDRVETTIHDLIAEGDKVVLHWSTTGRHIGPYGDIAATGRSITMAGIDILTLKDGRIVAASSMWDGLSVFDQLGVLTIGTEPAP
jgi:ketosteroid isomerase-like protein